ncbi:ABC transporter [Frankia canadensis]|uniref:ABC transporter n=1 Tax=Frankia canadensis TaxID=1836972 RepID=A0A2I2KV99_9ACTN|nr:ABC transporter ATP-binding protein [Frankia canadensis]SNQ49588.1 ABC transporter [Frankia canadensis]SOU56878.1 ABC transporter [Frankia canadensis]
MTGGLRGLVPAGQHRALGRYLVAVVVYAVSEGVAFGVLVPLLIDLIDGRTGRAGWWLVPLTAAAAVGWVAHYYLGSRALRLSTAWRRDLYTRIGEQLVRLPLGWFDGPRAGEVPQLVVGDAARVAGSVFLAQALLGALLTPVTIAVFLLAYDWRLGLAALVAAPVVVAALVLGGRLSARTEAAQHAATAQAGGRLVEFACAQPTLRATGNTAAGRAALDEALTAQHRAARREVVGSLPGEYLGELGLQLAFTALLLSGLALATDDALRPARMIALVVLGISLLRPLDAVVGLTGDLRGCQASARRIDDLLTVPPLPEPTAAPASTAARAEGAAARATGASLAEDQATGAHGGPPGEAGIELVDVRFAYPGGPEVLGGLTLSIPAGRTTALVGTSGAGKTTVTKLIARFHDVDAGAVRVGGVDVRDLPSAELLGRVALVFQDVYLFDATVEDNIRFGNPDATPDQVRDAARRARVDTIVDRLPDGWASPVGEGGRLLSGGERQRVAIARALCKDAPIVLLDEATASLDTENEAAVYAALAELAADRTVLIIAHRLDTIVRADQIAVLDGGRVLECGPHADLLARDGRYAAFWRERERARGWRLRHDDAPTGQPAPEPAG